MRRPYTRILSLFSLILYIFNSTPSHSSNLVFDGTAIILANGTALHYFDPTTRSFRPSSRMPAAINGICTDTSGALWVATGRGLAYVRDSTRTTFTPGNTSGTDGIPDDGIRAVLAGSGEMPALAGTRTGLLQSYGDSVWTPAAPPLYPSKTTALYRAPDSTVYIGTEDGIFIVHPLKERITIPDSASADVGASSGDTTGLPTTRYRYCYSTPSDTMLPGLYIKSIFNGPENEVHCVAYDYRQQRIDDMRGYINRRTPTGWNTVPFKGIFSGTAGDRYLTRTASTSYIYPLKGLSSIPIDSLTVRGTDCMAADPETMYVATGTGLVRVAGGRYTPVAALKGRKILACGITGASRWCVASLGYRKAVLYRRMQGGEWRPDGNAVPCDEVMARAAIGDSTWLGTDAGVIIVGAAAWRYLPYLSPCVSQEVTAISGADGIILVGTRKGLIRISATGKRAFFTTGLSDAAVRAVGPASPNGLWADAGGWHLRRNGAWLALNEMYTLTASGETMQDCYTTPDGTAWLYSPDHGGVNRCTGTDTVVRYASVREAVEHADVPLQDGPLWATNDDGTWLADNARWTLARYGSDSCWHEYDYAPKRLYTAPDGHIRFYDCNRLFEIRDGSVTGYGLPPHLAPRSLLSVPGHGVWIEGKNALMHMAGRRFNVYPLPASTGHTLPYAWTALPDESSVTGITRCGSALVAGNAQGLFKTDGAGTVTRLSEGAVRTTGCGPDGAAWAADDHGVVRFDADGGKARRYDIHDGLISNITTGICRAPDGTLWFLSLFGASIMAPDGEWESLTRFGRIASPYIQCAAPGPDGMLLGSHKGLLVQRNDHWDVVNRDTGLPSDTVVAVAAGRHGTVWASTPGGTVQIKDGAVTKRYSRLGCAGGSALAADADGTVWLLRKDRYGRGALYRFTGTGWKARAVGWNFTCLTVENGTILAGSTGGYYALPGDF